MATIDFHQQILDIPKFDPIETQQSFRGTEGQYLLPHSTTEIARLTRQHQFYKSTTGGQLLAVPTNNTPTLRILDAGCANGQWLSDLPLQYPTKKLSLHGIDIGSDLFHARPPFPPSDLRAHNLLTPIPASWGWTNTFDVIHQRLLVWAFRSDEWPTVINNLLTVLKPGGYIQLVEVEWNSRTVELEDLPSTLRKQALMNKWSTESAGMDIDIAYKLADLLRDAGCVDVTEVKFEHGYGAMVREREFAEYSAQLIVQCYRTLDQRIGDGGIPGVARDAGEFHAFLDDLEVQIRVHGYRPKLNFVYGRKV